MKRGGGARGLQSSHSLRPGGVAWGGARGLESHRSLIPGSVACCRRRGACSVPEARRVAEHVSRKLDAGRAVQHLSQIQDGLAKSRKPRTGV